MAEQGDAAGFRLNLPKGAMPWVLGIVLGGGGMSTLGAYAGAKGADVQVVAEAEGAKVRKDCDAKLEQVMVRLDGRLASIENNVGDIKMRLSFVEQSYRLYPRGTLGAPIISNSP